MESFDGGGFEGVSPFQIIGRINRDLSHPLPREAPEVGDSVRREAHQFRSDAIAGEGAVSDNDEVALFFREVPIAFVKVTIFTLWQPMVLRSNEAFSSLLSTGYPRQDTLSFEGQKGPMIGAVRH